MDESKERQLRLDNSIAQCIGASLLAALTDLTVQCLRSAAGEDREETARQIRQLFDRSFARLVIDAADENGAPVDVKPQIQSRMAILFGQVERSARSQVGLIQESDKRSVQ